MVGPPAGLQEPSGVSSYKFGPKKIEITIVYVAIVYICIYIYNVRISYILVL